MTFERARLIFALALLLPARLAAENRAATYLITPTYTHVAFEITKWMVMKQQGQFREFSGRIFYDPERPDRSTVDMTVQASSIDTKNDTRDTVLRSDDFFDAQRFPTLSFRSVRVEQDGADRVRITGQFTIHGITKTITIPVTMIGTHDVPNVGKLAGFETRFTIDRREYGVAGARWGAIPSVLSNEVEIHILMGAIKSK